MKKMMWMKKGILCALMAVCFTAAFEPAEAHAGWVTSALRKGNLKENETAAEKETKPSEESLKKDMEKKYEELRKLQNTRYNYMITCTYCKGSGRSSTACKSCKGKGIADTPGNFTIVLSCGYCMGSGYEKCSMCMGGQMVNPDYNTQCQARDEKIKKLENEIGQIQNQLRELNGGNLADGSGGAGVNPTLPYPTDPIYPTDPVYPTKGRTIDCIKCKNTGWVDCTLCGGTGYVEKRRPTPNYGGGSTNYYTVSERCTGCTGGSIPCYMCGSAYK